MSFRYLSSIPEIPGAAASRVTSMKMKWAADPLRAILGRDEPLPAAAIAAEVEAEIRPAAASAPTPAKADDRVALHTWHNTLAVCGPAATVDSLHQSLTRMQPLPWRAAEEVEREVVHLAMRRSGLRIEALKLEDVLQSCEEVEARHLIDNATLERHFRNLWHTSAAYCKQYMRGLLARKPGDHAMTSRASTAPGGMFREGFSLTRIVLPPFRVLQGSYRYAGRTWCLRTWGTPEDARLTNMRSEAIVGGQRLVIYEFETVESAPLGALTRLIERHSALAIASVAVDGDNGQRLRISGGRGQTAEVSELTGVNLSGGALTVSIQREATQLARDAVLTPVIGAMSPPASRATTAARVR